MSFALSAQGIVNAQMYHCVMTRMKLRQALEHTCQENARRRTVAPKMLMLMAPDYTRAHDAHVLMYYRNTKIAAIEENLSAALSLS